MTNTEEKLKEAQDKLRIVKAKLLKLIDAVVTPNYKDRQRIQNKLFEIYKDLK